MKIRINLKFPAPDERPTKGRTNFGTSITVYVLARTFVAFTSFDSSLCMEKAEDFTPLVRYEHWQMKTTCH